MRSSLPFLVNGLSLGLSIALVAQAMALVWRTVGIIDFGLGAIYLVSAQAVLFLRKSMGLPLGVAILGALAAGTLAAVLVYWAVYRRFLRAGSPLFVTMLVGLSVFLATQHFFGAVVGAQKFYFIDTILPGFVFAETRLNVAQIGKIATSIVAIAGLAAFCLKTDPGRTILAVADNKRLAQGVGISVDRTYLWTFVLAGLVVSAAAIPDVAESGVDPYVATTPLLLALAAIVVGGLGSFRSPVLGAVLLGLAFHLAVLVLPASWQEVIAYGFVVLVLIARPQGLFFGMNLVRERA